MQKPDLEKYDLPESPGVYFFMKGKDILYIGKATILKDRVRSYFGKDLIKQRGQHIVDMVALADKVSYMQTDSVLEALLLESTQIKKHKPYYNTKEKDDRSYLYIIFTTDSLPRVLFARAKDIDFKNSLYKKEIQFTKSFGPFPNAALLYAAMRIVRKIFPYFNEKTLQKDHYHFYRQLGFAPHAGEGDSRHSYAKNLKNLALFLSGKKDMVLKLCEKDMAEAARELRFEDAIRLRGQIHALSHIKDMSLITRNFYGDATIAEGFRIESFDIAHLQGSAMVGVMCVLLGGTIEKKEYRTFSVRGFTTANDPGALGEVLRRRFSHPEWNFPNILVVDGNEIQMNVAQKIVTELHIAETVQVVAVVKDEQHRPKGILGPLTLIQKYRDQILLANSEAHRFSLLTHTKKRRKEFIKK